MNESKTVTAAMPADTGPAHSDVQDLVFREQVELLYANTRIAQAVALAVGIIYAAVQTVVIEPSKVAIWLSALLVVSVARVILGQRYQQTPLPRTNVYAWAKYFCIGAATSGLVWGASGWLLYPTAVVMHQMIAILVVGAIVVGTATVLTPVYPAFLLFAICALTPMLLRVALDGDYVHLAIAGMGAIFLLAILVTGKRINRTVSASLKLRYENRDLVRYLTNVKEELQSANASLLMTQAALTKSNEDLEIRVAERTAELRVLDERKDEFMAMLSHELRNPLAPIRTSVYALRKLDPNSAKAHRALEIIDRQTSHLTRLVNDLLDATRIVRGKIHLQRERIDLIELVRRTAEDHQAVFQDLDVRLITRLPEALLHTQVDATRIAQMIGNLLQNAAKFTPAGGTVTLDLIEHTDAVDIMINDSGVGIEPALVPVLFKPFSQGKRSLARADGGLGLGLALVKGIAELHGGTVQVHSEGTGKGTSFIIRLPLETKPDSSLSKPTLTPTGATSRHLLIVDDNHDAAQSLAQLMQVFGHSTEVAYDGPSAITKARMRTPDVVLCDLGLPGMSGYDIARVLRGELAGTRLIAVSGYAQIDDVTRATEAGFDAHIAKPPDPDVLRNLINSAVPRDNAGCA